MYFTDTIDTVQTLLQIVKNTAIRNKVLFYQILVETLYLNIENPFITYFF